MSYPKGDPFILLGDKAPRQRDLLTPTTSSTSDTSTTPTQGISSPVTSRFSFVAPVSVHEPTPESPTDDSVGSFVVSPGTESLSQVVSTARSLRGDVLHAVSVAGVTFVAVCLCQALLMRGFPIPSDSMHETIESGDFTIVGIPNKLNGAERGDIVVFRDVNEWVPDSPVPWWQVPFNKLGFFEPNSVYMIKRVVAVGGDHVVYNSETNTLTVNGTTVEESYVLPSQAGYGVSVDTVVPEGHFFVLGDNRRASYDSRYYLESGQAFIPESALVGELWLTVSPDFSGSPLKFGSRGSSAFSTVTEPTAPEGIDPAQRTTLPTGLPSIPTADLSPSATPEPAPESSDS